jgi:precorrin-6A/cobalt-precorrin-6A reductase
MKILILGGTEEARQLAQRLAGLGHEVTTSLAGRTRDPILPEGELRIGPFGGADGLATYLRANHIDRLVDATHPFAGQISRNASAAAAQAAIPLVRYMRRPWSPPPGADWLQVGSFAEAAEALPGASNVLLTTGHAGLELFVQREDCHFVVRLIEAPDMTVPPHAKLLLMRPPYTLEDESTLLAGERISHLVTKNSGGSQTAAKLEAARRQGVKVVMIGRPTYGPAVEAESVDSAIEKLSLG